LPELRENGSVRQSRDLSRAKLLAAAQAECQASGWPWREPAKVTSGLFRLRQYTLKLRVFDAAALQLGPVDPARPPIADLVPGSEAQRGSPSTLLRGRSLTDRRYTWKIEC
jgi:hypothetical protein